MLTCAKDAEGMLNSNAVRTKNCKRRLTFIVIPCHLSFVCPGCHPQVSRIDRLFLISICSMGSHPQMYVTPSVGRCCVQFSCLAWRDVCDLAHKRCKYAAYAPH